MQNNYFILFPTFRAVSKLYDDIYNFRNSPSGMYCAVCVILMTSSYRGAFRSFIFFNNVVLRSSIEKS